MASRTRVCVVESQITGKEFTFDYEDEEGLEAGLRRVTELDGQEPGTEFVGNYNWMSGPFPGAPGDGNVAVHDPKDEA